jgi:aspartokinase
VSYKNIIGWENIRNELKNKFGSDIKMEFDFGAVSLIGEGVNEDNKLLNESIDLLIENNIRTYGITTTSFRISLIINKELLTQAVQVLHKNWIEI